MAAVHGSDSTNDTTAAAAAAAAALTPRSTCLLNLPFEMPNSYPRKIPHKIQTANSYPRKTPASSAHVPKVPWMQESLSGGYGWQNNFQRPAESSAGTPRGGGGWDML